MKLFKSALRHIQAVLPKSWQRPKAVAQATATPDRFEVVPAPGQRNRAPTIDWADIDRRLPEGDPLKVMDEVLGSSARYSVVRRAGFYQSEASTSTSQSLASLAPLELEDKQKK